MFLLSWIVVSFFIAVTAVAAGRLLLLHRQTRGLPELLIAILILGVGTFGVGGSFVILSTVPEGALRTALSFIPTSAVNGGMAALCLFTWRVYRPNSKSARAFCTALVSAVLALVVYAISQGSTLALQERPVALASSVIYVTTMAWSAVEALLYWSTMRRRRSLGLADPVLTNRFLLWGLATGTAAEGIALGAVAQFGFGLVGLGAGPVTLCYAVHGSLSAVFFWLAFQPPKSYVGWVSRGFEAS
jgi:hypothetical protein